MKTNKVYYILILLLAMEINTVYSKVARYKRTINYKKKRNSEIPSDCGSAIIHGSLNLIVGTFHGFVGFSEKLSLDKCEGFVKVMGEVAKFLDIKTEGIQMDHVNLETVDFEYLEILDSDNKKSKLDKKALKLFEEKKQKKEENKSNYQCFKSINDSFLETVKTGIELISNLRIPPIVMKTAKFGKNLGKSIHCILCTIKNIVYMITIMILSPLKIKKESILAVFKEVKKLYNTGKFIFKPAFKIIEKIIRFFKLGRTVDDFVKKVSEKIAKVVSEIKTKFQNTVNKITDFFKFLKEKILSVIGLFSKKVKSIIEESDIFKTLKNAFESLKNKITGDEKKEGPSLKEKLTKLWSQLTEVGTCFKTLGNVAKDIFKNTFEIAQNIITLVNTLTTLLAGSQGTAIPIVILIFIEIAFAIACDNENFEKMYLAFKYALMNSSAYSFGAGVGVALKAIGNPKSIALKLLKFLNSVDFDLNNLDSLEEVSNALFENAVNSAEAKIEIVTNIGDFITGSKRRKSDEEVVTCIATENENVKKKKNKKEKKSKGKSGKKNGENEKDEKEEDTEAESNSEANTETEENNIENESEEVVAYNDQQMIANIIEDEYVDILDLKKSKRKRHH